MSSFSSSVELDFMSNIANSRTMNFQLGAIHTGMSDESFNRRIVGDGATYRKRLRCRIPCPYCGVEFTLGSMMAHYRRLHGTIPDIDLDLLPSQSEVTPPARL